MSADEKVDSPELSEIIEPLESDVQPKPMPIAIPLKALAMLRQLQEQIERSQAQMKGIVQGVASVSDIPDNVGVDLGAGIFITE